MAKSKAFPSRVISQDLCICHCHERPAQSEPEPAIYAFLKRWTSEGERRYIASRVGYGVDIEDLAQDVFIELCKSNGRYDGRGNVERYLFGIARNVIRRYHRERTNSIRTVPIDSIDDIGPSYDIQQQQDLVRQVSAEQLKKAIKDVLAQLPPKAQEAIQLRFFECLNSKEAAKKAGCFAVTFRYRLHMAVKALRKLERVWGESNARNL
jgi:RNA polymerase sigma-70 factor (ECF subfamily)